MLQTPFRGQCSALVLEIVLLQSVLRPSAQPLCLLLRLSQPLRGRCHWTRLDQHHSAGNVDVGMHPIAHPSTEVAYRAHPFRQRLHWPRTCARSSRSAGRAAAAAATIISRDIAITRKWPALKENGGFRSSSTESISKFFDGKKLKEGGKVVDSVCAASQGVERRYNTRAANCNSNVNPVSYLWGVPSFRPQDCYVLLDDRFLLGNLEHVC